jgi:DNA-binding CsgD family transcriptional regulator/tetratricopeptide (TPR) repeat protein
VQSESEHGPHPDPWTGRALPLLGRADELRTIDTAVEAASAGRGGTVVLVGEAGIGKTRLLEECIDRGRDAGMAVLIGRAVRSGGAYRALSAALAGALRSAPDDASEAGAALGPYRAAMARVLPDFGPPVSPSGDPAVEVGEGTLRLLRHQGAGRGAMLVLDDMHWADPDTVAALEYLTDDLAGQPVLVVLAARDLPTTVLGMAQRIARRPATRLHRLGRLDPDAASVLARACAPDAEDPAIAAVVSRSDGLPVLIEGLATGLGQRAADPAALPLPDSYRALVEEQLGHLTDHGRALLEVSAVAGTDVGCPVLAESAGVPFREVDAATEAAVAAGLVTRTDGDTAWRHALTADAVLATVLPSRRQYLAGEVARRLVDSGHPQARTLAVDLFLDAGDRQRARDLLLDVARTDIARGALRTAREALDRLAGFADPTPAAAIERVRLLTLTGEVSSALEAGAAVVDDAAGDAHAELCLLLARTCITAGRWAEAEAYVERAGRPEDPRSEVLLADAAYGAGRPADALDHADRAVVAAERAGDRASLAGALLVSGRAHALPDPGAARAAFTRAVQVASDLGDTALRVTGLLGLATVEALERPDPPSLAVARDLAVRSGLLAKVAALDVIAAELVLISDGPSEVLPIARRSADLAHRLGLGDLQSGGELYTAYALTELGDRRAAEQLLASATARPEAPVEMHAGAAIVRAVASTIDGDLERATSLADEAAALVADHGSAFPVHWWGLWLLLRIVTRSDEAAARSVFDGSHVGRRRVNRGAAAYADAVLAGRNGDADACAAAIGRGDLLLEGHPWWHRFLRVQLWSVAAPEGWGDPVPGLRADLAWLEERDADALARRCRDLLRVAGAPVRRVPGLRVPPSLRELGITSREAEVLALIAQGMSNAEIAARFFVSVRTVETHVSRLLVKTGTADRTEVAAYADQLPRKAAS